MAPFSADNRARAKKAVALYPEPRSALIPLCHLAQSQDGWLTPEAIGEIAELVGVTAAEVRGTASFYDMLHTEPVGNYLVGVCTNIACMLGGAYEMLDHAQERLGIPVGGTTDDGMFTLEETECLAGCDSPPCVVVNYRYFLGLDNDGFDRLIESLETGELAADVPRHGTLCRVERAVGRVADPSAVAVERAESDEARAARARAKESA